MMIHDDNGGCWTSALLEVLLAPQGHFESGGIDKLKYAIDLLLILSHSVRQTNLKVLGDCRIVRKDFHPPFNFHNRL
jgi:hypothetical protein